GRFRGALAVVLLAFSSKWAIYINLLQYETLLAFFCTTLALIFLKLGRQAPSPREKPLVVSAALTLTSIGFLHFRMLILIPFAGFAYWRIARRLNSSGSPVAALLLLLLPPFVAVASW